MVRVGVGGCRVGEAPHRDVQLERGQVDHPDQRGQVVDHQVADRLARRPRARAVRDHLLGPHPLRPVRGRVLLEERQVADAVREAAERHRPAGDVRQQHRRDPLVVVEHLGLGEAVGRVEHLGQVGQRERAPVHLHRDLVGLVSLASFRHHASTKTALRLPDHVGRVLVVTQSPVGGGPHATRPRPPVELTSITSRGSTHTAGLAYSAGTGPSNGESGPAQRVQPPGEHPQHRIGEPGPHVPRVEQRPGHRSAPRPAATRPARSGCPGRASSPPPRPPAVSWFLTFSQLPGRAPGS